MEKADECDKEKLMKEQKRGKIIILFKESPFLLLYEFYIICFNDFLTEFQLR